MVNPGMRTREEWVVRDRLSSRLATMAYQQGKIQRKIQQLYALRWVIIATDTPADRA